MPEHAYADESQGPPYRVALAFVEAADVAATRSAVRAWRHRGSRTFHASSESDEQRRRALDSLAELPVSLALLELARVVVPRARRQLVVAEAARFVSARGVTRFVLEDAEPERARDLATLAQTFAASRAVPPAYVHLRAVEDPLLWIPDLVAWAYSRGGRWRARLPDLLRVRVP